MAVREAAYDGCSKGLEEGKQRAKGSAEEYDVIARVNGACEGVFVGV